MKRASLATAALTTTPVLLVGANANRTGIFVSSPIGSKISLANSKLTAANQGLTIVASSHPIELCTCNSGDFVTKDIWAISPDADQTLTIIEVIDI